MSVNSTIHFISLQKYQQILRFLSVLEIMLLTSMLGELHSTIVPSTQSKFNTPLHPCSLSSGNDNACCFS